MKKKTPLLDTQCTDKPTPRGHEGYSGKATMKILREIDPSRMKEYRIKSTKGYGKDQEEARKKAIDIVHRVRDRGMFKIRAPEPDIGCDTCSDSRRRKVRDH